MPYQANYPATVAEVLDDSMTFRPAALRAVRQLARSRPWRGTRDQRMEKFRVCIAQLAECYGLPRTLIRYGRADGYCPQVNTIYLRASRLSVVSLLHEFAHARGFDERQACRWSINLFRRCFPRSYANCRHVGHMLVNNASERN